jgi:hypothetical protein
VKDSGAVLSPRLRLLRLLAVFAAVIGALWFGALLWQRRDLGPIEDRLVAAVALASATERTRSTHVDAPQPGWFGESIPFVLEALAPARARLAEASKQADRSRRDVLSGGKPFDELDPSWRDALEEAHPGLLLLQQATHRRQGGLPRELGPLGDPGEPLVAEAWAQLRTATQLAALEVARLSSIGAVPAALLACVDGLAIARDLSVPGAMAGRLLAVALISELVQPCGRAFGQSIPADRARAALLLDRVAKDPPPLSAYVAAEAVPLQLHLFGAVMPPVAQRQLPAWVFERWSAGRIGFGPSPPQRLLLRHAWIRCAGYLAQLDEAAADDDADALLEQAARIGADAGASWNPALRALRLPDWELAAHRHLDGLHLLELLARAAHAEWDQTLRRPLLAPIDGEPKEVVLEVRASRKTDSEP